MADHSSPASHSGDFAAHRSTYEGFIKGSVALTLICIFVLISLVTFRFGHAWSVFLGFLTLFAGLVSVLVSLRTGSTRWTFPVVVLVIFAVITAINVA